MTVLTCEDCGAPHNDHEVRSRRVEGEREVEVAVGREKETLAGGGERPSSRTCAVH